jgi:hypothetical protein
MFDEEHSNDELGITIRDYNLSDTGEALIGFKGSFGSYLNFL